MLTNFVCLFGETFSLSRILLEYFVWRPDFDVHKATNETIVHFFFFYIYTKFIIRNSFEKIESPIQHFSFIHICIYPIQYSWVGVYSVLPVRPPLFWIFNCHSESRVPSDAITNEKKKKLDFVDKSLITIKKKNMVSVTQFDSNLKWMNRIICDQVFCFKRNVSSVLSRILCVICMRIVNY